MLMLVDAANLYFRAFYALPESITAPDGRPVNAIRGYLDMTASLIDKRRPTRHVACLDASWRPAFRVELIPSYKAHRVAEDGGEDVPDTLAPQIPVLLEVLAALGLATAGADGFEADDVIATLADRDADTVEVVSGDRDLLARGDRAGDRALHRQGHREDGRDGAARGAAEVRRARPRTTPISRCCAATRATGCPASPASARRPRPRSSPASARSRTSWPPPSTGSAGFPSGAANKVLAARDYLLVAPGRRARTHRRAGRGRRRRAARRAGRPGTAGRAQPTNWASTSSVNRLLVAIAAALRGLDASAPGSAVHLVRCRCRRSA